MKRFALSMAAAVLAFSLSACGGGGQQAQPPANQPSTETPSTGTPSTTAPSGSYDVATAESLYKNTCAACHGQDLQGTVGPNLQQVGSRLDKEQILTILDKGRNTMPGGLVKGTDAETLAAWLADKK